MMWLLLLMPLKVQLGVKHGEDGAMYAQAREAAATRAAEEELQRCREALAETKAPGAATPSQCGACSVTRELRRE